MKNARERIGIVGLGLIGASIALALNKEYYIAGNDADANAVSYCLKEGIIDGAEKLSGFKGFKAVFVCVPIDITPKVISDIYAAVGDSCIITDTASVKTNMCACPCRYVGGHPMAGTEGCGAKAARAHLFQNAYYAVVPSGSADDTQTVIELVKKMGAVPKLMTAEEHDRTVSLISHVPHAAAYALVNALETDQTIPGTGFLDTTRIALSNELLWTSVFMHNRENIIEGLDGYIERLNKMRGDLQKGNYEALRQDFQAARERRETLERQRYYMSQYTLDVDVIDRVGEIVRITGVLAQNGVNLINIGIMNSREGGGGALRLVFENEAGYLKAKQLLNTKGGVL